MKLAVEVTKRDIARGERNCGVSCPIALAMKRIGYPCFVGRDEFSELRGDKFSVELPEVAKRFMEDFDSGNVVHPVTFTIPNWPDSNR